MKSLKPSFFTRVTCIALIVIMTSVAAFASPTALTTIVLIQNNVAVTAGQLSLTFTACDTVNGNSFVSTGREVLLVNNTGGSTYTFTVSSVPDSLGRSDTSLTTYSVATTVITAVQMKYQSGWIQSGGTINLTCSNASLKYAVLQYN